MAKNYGRSAYRMTARRKAALRKAQLASAKKRRRRRNAAIGAGIVGASAAAAYIGYSHPDKVRNIASDLKRRTPKFSRLRQGKIVETVQPLKKEETIVDSGVTRGWVNGAGPEAGQSKPKPRNTTITDADRARAQNVRERLAEEDARNESLVFGEGPKSRKDAWGNGRDTSLRGVPGAIKRGAKLSGKKISSLVDKQEAERVAAGASALDKEGREELVDSYVWQGTARGTYQGKLSEGWGKPRKRKTAAQKAAARKRRETRKKNQAKRRAEAEWSLQNRAFDQFIQDFE